VLVGLEGTGKSTLGRQMAVAAAAGRHPFLNAAIRPVRSLIVDLENPRPLLQRAIGKLQRVAQQFPSYQPGRGMVFSRPGGMDLRNARDSYRLADAIRRAKPDLIVAGPVYKMFTDNGDSSEQIHSGVSRFWDMIRERTGATLLMETHAPIASNYGKGRLLRPLGSGIWTRWPEFGIALVDNGKGEYLLDRFRGDREEGRDWPESLQRNQWPETGWPFLVKHWGDRGVPLEAPAEG
jgi:replicative DNA helicase